MEKVHRTKTDRAERKEAPKPKEASARSKERSSVVAHGVGRRKSAVARVWLKRGRGAVRINTLDYTRYFDTDISRADAVAALKLYPQAKNFDVEVNVEGGGLCAQAGAVRLGIARALTEMNEDLRPLYREYGFLTVDSRVKERKKYGQKAARRKFQFVKR